MLRSTAHADCVRRFATPPAAPVGSLLLGLYDAQGLLDHVGFTSAIADSERAALTRSCAARRPGLHRRRARGPSRWSTSGHPVGVVEPKLVVEVQTIR